MPISALSENTSRAISSSLVLKDATSVVKELVDNALDSGGNNIIIEISTNTLDVIQVKDNGNGIGVEDRQLLCRRGYTSKISTLDDLAQLGGTFLGFRGEALASVAELSEAVVVTTRVDGESIGALLKYNDKAELTSTYPASHGVGTTVRVSCFLKNVPVRRQTTLKQSAKVLTNIKKLLQGYAFARPNVRFQLKVLKAKNDKANWSYAPCRDTTDLLEVVLKLCGKDASSKCIQRDAELDDSEYTATAAMLNAEIGDLSGTNTGPFLVLDGRPLSHERGFGKSIVRSYKDHLLKATQDSTSTPSRPLIYLRLSCPKGSYDVNIEPSKNEVLFENSAHIEELVEQLLNSAYGTGPTADNDARATPRRAKATSHGVPPIYTDTDLASRLNASVGNDNPPAARAHLAVSTADAAEEDEIQHVMATVHKDGSAETVRQERATSEGTMLSDVGSKEKDSGDEDIMNPRVTNPFTLTRLNTRIRPQETANPSTHFFNAAHMLEKAPVLHSDSTQRNIGISPSSPSPSISPERQQPYQNPGPPNRPWKDRRSVSPGSPSSAELEDPPSNNRLLDGWVQAIHTQTGAVNRAVQPVPTQVALMEDASVGEETSAHSGEALSMIPRQPLVSGQQRPFKSPMKRYDAGSTKRPHVTTPRNSTLNFGVPQLTPPSSTNEASISPERQGSIRDNSSAELNDIMEFEHRKRAAMLQHRQNIRRRQVNVSCDVSASASAFDQVSESTGRSEQLAPNVDMSSRFSASAPNFMDDIPPQPSSASYTQNPRWNRFQNSVRRLESDGVDDETNIEELEPTRVIHSIPIAGPQRIRLNAEDPACGERFKIALDTFRSSRDPRAVLIRDQRHLVSQNGDMIYTRISGTESSSTGRAKISTLPLEKSMQHLSTRELVASPSGELGSPAATLEIAFTSGVERIYVQDRSYVEDGKIRDAISELSTSHHHEMNNLIMSGFAKSMHKEEA